jgi:hypothetical protein
MTRAPLTCAVIVVLLALSAPLAQGREDGGWYPAAGIGYLRPMDSRVRDLYSGGPSFFGAVGYAWPQRMRVEVRMDWYRQSSHPPNPLAAVSNSQLTLTPVSVELHLGTGHGTWRPFVLAGPGLIFSEEKFTYGLFRPAGSAIGRRTDVMGTFGGGVEMWRQRWVVRALARALITSGTADVLRATGRSDERTDTASPSAITAGLEFQLR